LRTRACLVLSAILTRPAGAYMAPAGLPTWQLLGTVRGRILFSPEEGAHPETHLQDARSGAGGVFDYIEAIAVTPIWVASVPRPLNGRRREAPVCLLF
jgi:hypothetical protein